MIDLKLAHVSKAYRIRQGAAADAPRRPLSRGLGRLLGRRRQFWAVRDVSFEVERGEALGIIGHNGAGKSTVLKLLAGITAPTSGEITISGRLSALIEVGSGFHPELTGRENIFLSGSILGMRRREIADKLDDIVEFAGVGDFINEPVKRYSSGMYVRLGFSIAAHLDPDILLLDEVLSVGDAAFQAKCLRRIEALREGGKTIVFISHDLRAVERLCDRVLLLQRGAVAASGRPHEVIAAYERTARDFKPAPRAGAPPEAAAKAAEVTAITFRQLGGAEADATRTGSPLVVRLQYRAREDINDACFEVHFFSRDGDVHCHLTTALGGERIDVAAGAGAVEFFCPELGLQPGHYFIDATIKHRGTPPGDDLDWQFHCAVLRVDTGHPVRGTFYMPYRWSISQNGIGGVRAALQ